MRAVVQPSETSSTAVVVTVEGEVDIANADHFRQALNQASAASQVRGHDCVVVDLAGVTFMDSTGLGVLVGGLKRASARGGRFELAAPQPNVMRMLRVTGLAKVTPVVPGLADSSPAGLNPA